MARRVIVGCIFLAFSIAGVLLTASGSVAQGQGLIVLSLLLLGGVVVWLRRGE
jgi:hypothetical protein